MYELGRRDLDDNGTKLMRLLSIEMNKPLSHPQQWDEKQQKILERKLRKAFDENHYWCQRIAHQITKAEARQLINDKRQQLISFLEHRQSRDPFEMEALQQIRLRARSFEGDAARLEELRWKLEILEREREILGRRLKEISEKATGFKDQSAAR